jgi:hypothetical protein
MDNRISFLNRLKLRLNDYIHKGNQEEENWSETSSSYTGIPVNFSTLRAHMLVENVKSGIVLDNGFFDNSGVYAEYCDEGGFSFHIYPRMSLRNESIKNLEKEKRSIPKQLEIISSVK